MSKQVYLVREYTGKLQATTANFNQMFRANFEAGYAMRNRLSQSTIANNLSGVTGTALSILLGVAGATISSTAISIASIITSITGTELSSQAQVIDQGANALLRITRWLEARPAYKAAEIEVAFLEYTYTDGSKARFVQGDSYVLGMVQTENGWIHP